MNRPNPLDEIATMIWQIRYLEKPVKRCEAGDDPMDAFMAAQFRSKQRRLIEKVFMELAHLRLSFGQKAHFLRQLATYLEKTEQGEKLPASSLEPEWKGIDRLLAAKQMAA